jgi:hypothetical protein
MDSRMQNIQSQRPAMGFIKASLVIGSVLAIVATPASATPREQAKRIHDRLAGVPATDTVLGQMESDVVAGRADLAAETAMNNSSFYNVTVKNWVAPWTNRDMSVFVELNDYVATVAGMARDDVPFNTVLSDDILYIGNSGLGLPAYSMGNNDHYRQMELQGVDMRTDLVRTTQSSVTSLPPAATAGVMTSRAAAEAFFIAGTNRAMFRFTLINHLCHDMGQVQNTSYAPDRIRQDVSRSPGGDSRVFLNGCIGCHNGMDPMAQAFAYYDFDETSASIQYTAGAVHSKYFNNDANFPQGFATPDDAWENRWREGQNALLGWDPNLPGTGAGAKSLGQELGNSDAFAECQVQKVFKAVCLRDPVDDPDRTRITTMVTNFRSSNYRLKTVFSDAAVYCMGD